MNLSSSMVSRRAVLGGMAAGGAAMLTGLAGCSSTSGGSGSATGDVSYWTQVDPTNTVQQAAITAFNKTSAGKVTLSTIPSNGYLNKVRTAMGSSAMPGLFFNWGGGSLGDYVKSGRILELDADLQSHFLTSPLQAGIVDGKFVGVPCRGTQPVFIFYNKSVFAEAGVKPPTTYGELTNLVTVFKNKGILPFTVAGNATSSWTELMWIEYLVDRLAGPDLFKSIAGGDWSLWKEPAILQTAQMIAELVSSGAFGSSFASVNYGAGGTSTLLAQGKAAMELMGTWEYAMLESISPSFVKNDLGYVPFPTVEGGKGDIANLVGNPTNYISMTTKASRTTAAEFLKTTYSDAYVEGLVKAGEIPVTSNAAAALANAADPAYAKFQFNAVQNAPAFTQSWDQALGSTLATPMLTEIQKLFNGQDTPQQFVNNVFAIQA